MALDTNLSGNPYFDDYTPESNFHRVLFRPATAVQTRELNELQSIMQDQLDKFGRHIFREGSVIEGCAFSFDREYDYVKLTDAYSNGTVITASDLVGKIVRNSNGLEALVVNSISGLQSLAPDLNTIYVKYKNSAVYANGVYQKLFDPDEIVSVYSTANVLISTVTVASNTADANVGAPIGRGYGFSTTEGTIFSKGFFVRVEPQSLIVEKYSQNPNNVSIGFYVDEDIITPEANTNLLDNAAGAKNYTAPGAHRLKLIPNLVKRTTSDTSNTVSFFSLVDFKEGYPVSVKRDAQYAALAKELARRTFEESGDYVVNPFIVTTELKNANDADYSTHLNVVTTTGVAYVKGHRVEFINKNFESLRRGTDTSIIENQQITTTFGQYVEVDDFCGEFNVDEVQQIELHNVAKSAVTDGTFLSTGYSSGTRIGTAYVKGVKFASGTPGTPDGKYYVYLFNIEMNFGYSFKDIRSLIAYDGGLKGVADVILSYDAASDSNIAKLQDTKKPTLLYSLGRKSVSENGFDNMSYTYRNKTTGTMLANGSISITIPAVVGSGSETFPYTGDLSNSQKESFIMVPTTTGYSENKTGTVSYSSAANTVTGTSTRFTNQYNVGDYIYLNGTTLKRIDFIANNTSMRVDSNVGATGSGTIHQKAFVAGCPIPMSNSASRTISANSTQATLSLGEVANATFNVTIYHPIYRSGTVPIKKNINKKRYVKIDCSNNAAGSNGPWSLGLPDVLKVNAIYVGSEGSYSNTGTDYLSSFTLDNGQRDNYYGLAKISVKPDASVRINDNSTILVELDHFTYDQSQGVGFFNANSYPIDDANTSNTTAITTLEIPLFRSSIGTYDLRSVVDFRTFAQNTAVSNTSVTNATINPSNVLTISTLASGSYLPEPDSSMYSDVTYYLPRIDKVALTTDGYLKIIEGVSSFNPVTPDDQLDSMTIAIVSVPPYPSLPPKESASYGRFDYSTNVKISQQRRWRMKDISGIDNRIKRLEYYTSLSLLEKSAQDLLVRSDTTGQNRFKNGFLVDPFNDHMIGNTLHPQYRIAVDPVKSEIRPYFAMFRNEYHFTSGSGCSRYGDLIMLDNSIESTPFISQKYSTKYRYVREGNIGTFSGKIQLYPEADLDPDITTAPQILNTYDATAPWEKIDAAWGTNWGSWETVSQDLSAKVIINEQAMGTELISSETAADGTITDTYLDETLSMVEYTNTLNQTRTGTDLIVNENTNSYDLGTFVNNITILPYIKSNTITFKATGLRPNTKFYAFFDDVPVTSYCSPAKDATHAAIDSYIATDSSSQREVEKVSGALNLFGYIGETDLISDQNGVLWGKFKIPENYFRSLQLEFMLLDVEDPSTTDGLLTSKATATYYANRTGFSTQNTTLNIREPIISHETKYDSQSLEFRTYDTMISSSISRTVTPPPPPPPQPAGDACGCGSIICTELYRLGLMDRDTYLADEAFGAHLRNVDPDVYYGYLKWANHVVSWMRGDNPNVMFWIRDEKKRREIETNLTIKITHRIATPWAEHMQYLMGGREKDNLVGKVIMGIGRPISKLLNKLPKFGKEKASKPVSYLMIGLFMMLYYMSKVFGDKVGFPKEINKA